MKAGPTSPTPGPTPETGNTETISAEQLAADEFVHALVASHSGKVEELPDFSADLNHKGRVAPDADAYHSLKGVYLASEVIHAAGGPHIPRLGFALKPFRRAGREDSRRKVFFGNLELQGEEQVQTYPVAVKPFTPQAFDYAIHETGMLQFMRREKLPTLNVLGFVAVKGTPVPRAYALTHEQRGITTLDNTNWRELPIPERWARMRPALDTLVALHSNLLFHGDLKFKNVAYGEEDRSICVVDPEEAVSLRGRVEPFADIPGQRLWVQKKMSADFTSLELSVEKELLGSGLTEKDRFEDMLEYVYDPYFLMIMKGDSPYKTVLMGAFEDMLEQKRQIAWGEFTGRSTT